MQLNGVNFDVLLNIFTKQNQWFRPPQNHKCSYYKLALSFCALVFLRGKERFYSKVTQMCLMFLSALALLVWTYIVK